MRMKKRELFEIISMSIAAICILISIFTLLLENKVVRISEEFIVVLVGFITMITTLYTMAFVRRVRPKKHVFALYAVQDSKDIKKYSEWLLVNLSVSKRYRFEIIYQENAISYGDNIYAGMKSVIDKSDIILLYISQAYLSSPRMLKEYDLAKESNKIIIPIILENVKERQTYPDELQDIKSVNLYKGLSEQEKQHRIVILAQDLLKNRFDA